MQVRLTDDDSASGFQGRDDGGVDAGAGGGESEVPGCRRRVGRVEVVFEQDGDAEEGAGGGVRGAGEVGGGQTPRAMDDLLKSFNLILRKI